MNKLIDFLPIVLSVLTLALCRRHPHHHNRNHRTRIVGGDEATIEEHPYMVAIWIKEDYKWTLLCGGTIIDSITILTAAHCVKAGPNLVITAGTANLNFAGEPIRIVSRHWHEDYDESTGNFDLGFAKLEKALNFSDKIQVIDLVDQGEDYYINTHVTVLGWGGNATDPGISPILYRVSLPIIDLVECQSILGSLVTPWMFCAGYYYLGDMGYCGEDRGGPAIVPGAQFGIASKTRHCAAKGYPQIFTRLSVLRQWIEEHANV